MLTIPSQSGPGSDGNKGVLHIPQSSSITGTSPLDCLVSYSGHSMMGGSYPSAEKQSVYSTAPADWANIYVCACVYIYIYVYIYVCIYIYIYIHMLWWTWKQCIQLYQATNLCRSTFQSNTFIHFIMDNSEWIFWTYKPNVSINQWDTIHYSHVLCE